MTVRELIAQLSQVKDLKAEVMLSSDPEGNVLSHIDEISEDAEKGYVFIWPK